jgi:hypothetical protein
MKNLLFLLAAIAMASLGHSAPTYSKIIKGNIGQSLPLFGSSSSTQPAASSLIYLDTSEVDTAYYFYDLIDKPVVSLTDTVGWVSFAVKDSVGTDSAAAKVVWYGNNRSDGLGIWTAIDSVTKGPTASASSYAAVAPAAVVNSKGYAALMFTLVNPLHAAVAQKCVVKDTRLNRRARLTSE